MWYKFKCFVTGTMFTLLVCSVCLNVYLVQAAKDGLGYNPQQRAQMTALVEALEIPTQRRKP